MKCLYMYINHYNTKINTFKMNANTDNKDALFDNMKIYSIFTIGMEIKNFNKTRLLEVINEFSKDLTTLYNFKSLINNSLSRHTRLMNFYNFKDDLLNCITELTYINNYIDELIEVLDNETRYYLK